MHCTLHCGLACYSLLESRYHSFLVFGLIGVLVWLPLPFGSNQAMYWFTGQVALQFVTIGTLVLFASGRMKVASSVRFAWLPVSLFAFFLLSQSLLHLWPGAEFSVNQYATNAQLLKTFCLFQIFCLTLLLVNNERRFKWLVMALVISGTFQSLYGILMSFNDVYYIWDYAKPTNMASGTFVNRNHLAGYLEMTIALGLGLMIAKVAQTKRTNWREYLRGWVDTLLGEKARVRVCLVLMVIAMILTRSRLGNTAFFVSMGIAGLIGLILFRGSQRGVVTLFVSILIIDIVLLGAFFGIDRLQQRMEVADFADGSRSEFVSLSLELFYQSPWFGHGLGTFSALFPQVRDASIVGFLEHAHSDLVQFPIEVGLLGSVPLVLLFLSSLIIAIRTQIKRRHRFFRAMGFSATMAMIAIAIHSFGDFNLQIFANAATFVCILALPWIAMYLPSRRVKGRSKCSG